VEVTGLETLPTISRGGHNRVAHLGRRGDPHGRMRTKAHGEREGRLVLRHVDLYISTHLGLDGGDVAEPLGEFVGHPDPWQIRIAASKSEPTSHLKKRVVRRHGADE